MRSEAQSRSRQIPSVSAFISEFAPRSAELGVSRPILVQMIRQCTEAVRSGQMELEGLRPQVEARLAELAVTTPRRVINATGVLLHTNLGRAALSSNAINAMVATAGYTNVEYDLMSGGRSVRGAVVERALTAMTGAEAALLVNNNAAGLFLAAQALGADREVVISRGDMIEFGAGARVVEIVEAAGAHVVEVGASNRVHVDDYKSAITEKTAFVLKVHAANFVTSGFTSVVEARQLAALDVPLVWDIGSGLLRAHDKLLSEPDFKSAIEAGSALVLGSGDKLLGGPQAGVIVGSKQYIDALRRHPVMRALRLDKIRLSALHAVLTDGTSAIDRLLQGVASSEARAATLIDSLSNLGVQSSLRQMRTVVGGGGAPEWSEASWGIAIAESLFEPLRRLIYPFTPVVGVVEGGQCLLNLAAVASNDDDELLRSVQEAARSL